MADDASGPVAAVREDAATLGLQAVEAALFPDAGTCRVIEEHEGAVPSRQSVPTWLTASRPIAKDPVENRSLILRVFLPFVFSPSGTLQIRVFSSFTVSFSLPMIS